MKKYKSYSTSIRIEAELFERIHAIAKNENTSSSEVMRGLIISGIESKKVKSAESKPEEHHDFTRKILDIIMRSEIQPEQKINLYNEISSL